MGSLEEWLQRRGILRPSDDIIPEPIPVRLVEVTDSAAARQNLLNTSGQVTEANSANINTYVQASYYRLKNNEPLAWKANGTESAATADRPWKPIPTLVGTGTQITADANGNIGIAAAVLGAVASKQLDIAAILQVDTTGAYQTQWCEDPTGTPAAITPDYFGTNWAGYLVAGYPYMLRVLTLTDNKAFGYGAGTNGEWPNSSNMYITGYYREV